MGELSQSLGRGGGAQPNIGRNRALPKRYKVTFLTQVHGYLTIDSVQTVKQFGLQFTIRSACCAMLANSGSVVSYRTPSSLHDGRTQCESTTRVKSHT